MIVAGETIDTGVDQDGVDRAGTIAVQPFIGLVGHPIVATVENGAKLTVGLAELFIAPCVVDKGNAKY